MSLTLEQLLNQQIKQEREEPSTSAEQPSSLLDILIKTDDSNNDELELLDKLGNIGEAVISQFSREEDDTVQDNAMKLFDEAMSYMRPPEVKPKRKYTKWKDRQNSTLEGLLEEGNGKLGLPNESLEKKRKYSHKGDNIADQLNKEWIPDGKAGFSDYCKKFQKLVEPKDDMIKLYMNALKMVKTGMPQLTPQSRMTEASKKVPIPSPTKRKSNHKEEEEKWYEQEKLEDIFRHEDPNDMVMEAPADERRDTSAASFSIVELGKSVPVAGADLSSFNPGMKYEREKLFRTEAIQIFMEVFAAKSPSPADMESIPLRPIIPKRRGRPKKNPSTPHMAEEVEMWNRKEALEHLIERFNAVMENKEKVWSSFEVEVLGRFYDRFKEKMNFTIVQTKELSNFLRRVFGRLEEYEIEREKDALLAEKRKFWQEYRLKNEQPRKKVAILRSTAARTAPVRPYIRQNLNLVGETEEEKKKRKAAYLREWRVRRAEKQNLELQSRIAVNSEIVGGPVLDGISRIM